MSLRTLFAPPLVFQAGYRPGHGVPLSKSRIFILYIVRWNISRICWVGAIAICSRNMSLSKVENNH